MIKIVIGRELSVRFFSPPDPENSRNCNSTNSVTSILVSLAAAALRDDTRELWQLGNDDGDGNEDVKKAIGLLFSKTTTLQVHHAFLYISLPSLHENT